MIRTSTGSTGNAVSDSLTRGVISAAIMGVLSVLARKTDILTAEDLGDLFPFVIIIASLLWGAFDRWLRPKLPAA